MRRARSIGLDVALASLAVVLAAGVGALIATTYHRHPSTSEPAILSDADSLVQQRSTALFIGDSYTSGLGTSGTDPYPCIAASRRGWNCVVSGLPGTGYIIGGAQTRFPLLGSPTGSSATAAERVPYLRSRYAADVVVLDVGRNDVGVSTSDMLPAVIGTLNDVRSAWPDAKIVLIRPWVIERPGDSLGLDSTFWADVLGSVSAEGVTFVDPQSTLWLAGDETSSLLLADGDHPNDAGITSIAALLDSSFDAVETR